MSAIGGAIGRALRCTRCGASGAPGSCACWLRLACPVCEKGTVVTRVKIDPPAAVELRYPCPSCRCGASGEAVYVDRDGSEVPL